MLCVRISEAILISTHTIPFSIIKKKITLNYPNLQVWDFFQGTKERVRNSRGKRAISVRTTEDLLYLMNGTKVFISVFAALLTL